MGDLTEGLSGEERETIMPRASLYDTDYYAWTLGSGGDLARTGGKLLEHAA